LQLGKVRQTSTCLSSLPARKWQPERTELCLEIWRVVVCSEWGDGKRTPHPGSPHSREPSFPSALLPSDSWATAASPHLRYLDDQNGHWAIGSSLGSWFQPGLDAECQLTKESFVDSPTPSPTHTHTHAHTPLPSCPCLHISLCQGPGSACRLTIPAPFPHCLSRPPLMYTAVTGRVVHPPVRGKSNCSDPEEDKCQQR
jgi:hypothetical protein